jgi:hypothetical protein
MLKFLVKLAFAALIANAAWRVGSAYAAFYRFRDAVEESARFSADKSADVVRMRVLELANQYDLPIDEDDVTVTRQQPYTHLTGRYAQPIAVIPGYEYPWTFSWDMNVLTGLPALAPSPHKQP